MEAAASNKRVLEIILRTALTKCSLFAKCLVWSESGAEEQLPACPISNLLHELSLFVTFPEKNPAAEGLEHKSLVKFISSCLERCTCMRRKKYHASLEQEKLILVSTRDCFVLALIHTWLHPPIPFANLHKCYHLLKAVV